MSLVFNSDEEYSLSDEEDMVQIDVECPSRLNPYIIGYKGSNITPVRKEFPEVRIDIGDTPDYIQLKGSTSKVEQVKNKLETMIKEGLQKYKMYNIEISKDMKNYLLEKSGYHITQLRQETGVSINIAEPLEKCTLKMEGNEDGLEKARKAIVTLIEQLDNLGDYVEEDIIIENRYHGALIGHQAVTLMEIYDKFKALKIRFPEKDETSDIIKIQGPKKMVDQCHLHLLQLVEIRKQSIAKKSKDSEMRKDSENMRKLFVGGINYATTDDSLISYFSQWGKVVDAVAMKDQLTNRPRGYGFVTFTNPDQVDDVQRARPHKIDGRLVETKRAIIPQGDTTECRDIEVHDIKMKRCCYDTIFGTEGHNINTVKRMFNKVEIELTDKDNDIYVIQLKGLKEDINQCDNQFHNLIKECESSRLQSSTSTTSINSEGSSWVSRQSLNAGNCLEHSENVLNLRCVTHKAWICNDCCDEDHPRNFCRIITFEEELSTRKLKEEQRLYDESKKISDTITNLTELADKKENEKNIKIKELKEMQIVIENMKSDIGQIENEMSFISQNLSEGKQLTQKLDGNKDHIAGATSISELSSITKKNSTYLLESKNWLEKCKNDN